MIHMVSAGKICQNSLVTPVDFPEINPRANNYWNKSWEGCHSPIPENLPLIKQ